MPYSFAAGNTTGTGIVVAGTTLKRLAGTTRDWTIGEASGWKYHLGTTQSFLANLASNAVGKLPGGSMILARAAHRNGTVYETKVAQGEYIGAIDKQPFALAAGGGSTKPSRKTLLWIGRPGQLGIRVDSSGRPVQ